MKAFREENMSPTPFPHFFKYFHSKEPTYIREPIF